jgi:hypothetical protein
MRLVCKRLFSLSYCNTKINHKFEIFLTAAEHKLLCFVQGYSPATPYSEYFTQSRHTPTISKMNRDSVENFECVSFKIDRFKNVECMYRNDNKLDVVFPT